MKRDGERERELMRGRSFQTVKSFRALRAEAGLLASRSDTHAEAPPLLAAPLPAATRGEASLLERALGMGKGMNII